MAPALTVTLDGEGVGAEPLVELAPGYVAAGAMVDAHDDEAWPVG